MSPYKDPETEPRSTIAAPTRSPRPRQQWPPWGGGRHMETNLCCCSSWSPPTSRPCATGDRLGSGPPSHIVHRPQVSLGRSVQRERKQHMPESGQSCMPPLAIFASAALPPSTVRVPQRLPHRGRNTDTLSGRQVAMLLWAAHLVCCSRRVSVDESVQH